MRRTLQWWSSGAGASAIAATAIAMAVGAGPRPAAPPAREPRRAADGPLTGFACKVGPGVPIANGHMYSLNFDTGAAVDLGLPVVGVGVQGLAWDPTTSRLYGMTIAKPTTGRASLLDLTVMPGTLIGEPAIVGFGLGLSRSPADGKFYAITYGEGTNFLYRIDVTTGESHLIGMHFGPVVEGLAINAKGEAYAAGFGLAQLSLYRVNLTDGRLTEVGPLNHGFTGPSPSAMTFDPSGTLWAIGGGTSGNESRLYHVNIQTGNAQFIRFVSDSGWYGALEVVP